MAITNTIRLTLSYNGSTSTDNFVQITDTETAGLEQDISEEVTDGADQLVAYSLDISQAKTFLIWSTGGAMTVETNSSTVPDDTFTLVDGVPVFWTNGLASNLSIPLTADITALYVTNTGTATLNVRSLSDPTV